MVMVNIQSKVLIYQSELNFLAHCIMDFPESETGCDLFGFWTHSNHAVVQYVVGSGELAKEFALCWRVLGYYFLRDV